MAHIRGGRERLLSYAKALEKCTELKEIPGDGLEQAIRYAQREVAAASGEERGRLQCMLGQLFLFAERKTEAAAAQAEALELVNSPAARMEVLVSAIYACIPFRRVVQGLRYADEAASLLAKHTDNDVVRWKPVYLRNTGELLVRAGDYDTALPYLHGAVKEFSVRGLHKEAMRSKVDLAECLMLTGEMTLALSLCREVRRDPLCDFVLFRLNVVQGRLAARMGNASTAETMLDNAYKVLYEKVGDQDRHTARDLEKAKAEVAELRGDEGGARTLRYYARRFAAAVGVGFD